MRGEIPLSIVTFIYTGSEFTLLSAEMITRDNLFLADAGFATLSPLQRINNFAELGLLDSNQ